LLVQRLHEEDIEFFVSDTRDLPRDPGLQVAPLRHEPGGFFVRAGHPLEARRSVSLPQLWEHGVASVRLPAGVRAAIGRLLGLSAADEMVVALECDDVETLKSVALASDTVLAAPLAAVEQEVAAGTLRPVVVTGLPALFSDMGVVTLRGRTPSPMADLIIRRLPADQAKAKQATARRTAPAASRER
jgi:DNA-binding transcriptional LysR family regulator